MLVIQTVNAHPISLSSALVELGANRIRVEMQIMLEDLVLYHSLPANGEMLYAVADLQMAAQKHRQFVTDHFSIFDVDGNRILGRIEEEIFDQIGDTPVPQAELMKRSINFLLIYELKQEKPEYLTFLQAFGGPKSALPAMMDLYVTRNEQFEESAQIAYNRPHTVKIDWQRNPEGKRQTLAELRKQRKEQFRERLGIGSFSGLYSFLYINRFEVRHEILIPLLTLEQFLAIPRANADFLEISEQAAVRPAIEQFFRTHGKVTINGTLVEASIQRVNFFSLDIADFALNADPRRINIAQGRVGIIVSYASKKVPSSVDVQWDTFSQYAPFIDMTLLIGDQPPDRTYFHADAKNYQWTGQLVGPVVVPIKADVDLSADKKRTDLLQKLLQNIYRSFDFRQDEDVYDSLASSVQGDLLRQLYLRIKRSLILAEQGGELSHATAVEVISATPGTRPGVFEAVWAVTGVSEHWGHIHTRTTEYRAELKISQHEGVWKLAEFQLLDEKRIRFETSIRGNDSPN